jgi:hypothetical protein
VDIAELIGKYAFGDVKKKNDDKKNSEVKP